MKIRIKRFDKDLPLPRFDEADIKTGKPYNQDRIAGFDLYCRQSVIIQPHTVELVPINNVIEVPKDHFLLLCARSSTPWKKGLMLANGIGLSDPFYSGDDDELKAQFLNFTNEPVKVEKGEALVQGIILRREVVEWLEVDSMGNNGHGGYSTKILN